MMLDTDRHLIQRHDPGWDLRCNLPPGDYHSLPYHRFSTLPEALRFARRLHWLIALDLRHIVEEDVPDLRQMGLIRRIGQVVIPGRHGKWLTVA